MPTVVIGGGISGLACAYRLRQLAVPILLLEQAERMGGVIQSVKQDGFLFELGPQSFLSTELLLDLIRALSLEAELLRADSHAPRYVLVRGRLHRVPMGPPGLLATSLLSVCTKFRLLSEPLRRTRPPDSDESVADFVRRKFGAELLEHLVGPFVSGVHAGDPEKLSLRSAFPAVYQWEKQFGSVLRGAMRSRPRGNKPGQVLCSFREGVATLVRALRDQLGDSARNAVQVETVMPSKSNGKSRFEVRVLHHGRAEVLPADAVVVATETAAAGQILANVSTRFPELLGRIKYAAVVVVGAGLRREQCAHTVEGFGFLVPRKEKLRLLGTVWNSSLFPGRAPAGMVNLTSFAGGATDPQFFQLTNQQIVDIVETEVAGVLKISGPPVIRIVQRNARALPQYNLGHSQIIATLHEELARFPGLFLTGNYWNGPSVGTCVEQAFRTAEAVREYLSSSD